MPDVDLRHILFAVYLLLLGAGTYGTYVQQGETIEEIDQSTETVQKRRAELQDLREAVARLEQRASEGEAPRPERYKHIPDTMSTARMMSYLTTLTQTGFDAFNLGAEGRRAEAGYRVYTMTAEGRASFRRLYRFVWTLENNRPFYRLRDLQLATLDQRSTDEETGRPTMDVLVSFRMDVEAIYGVDGRRAPSGGPSQTDDQRQLPLAQSDPHPPVPAHVLPPARPASNPFHPLVFKQVPPNEHGRLNVEEARFLSIIGGEAVFETEQGIVRRGEGDRVYLGRIVDIDPVAGRLVARLDKGGIVERVERSLDETDSSSASPRP